MAIATSSNAGFRRRHRYDLLGDWYADREPGPVDDDLRVGGLKIHLDNG